MIRFECQNCGKPLTAPDASAGETGRCPHCKGLFDIPQPRPAVLRLVCPGCDKTLGVPATAAGKPAACPACGTRFQVPADAEPEPAPAPRARTRAAARDDEDDDRPSRRRPRDDDDDAPRGRRRPADDDDDDEPVLRGRRLDDDDDEEEDDRPARRGKKPGKRRKSRGGGGLPDWYRGPLGRLAENAVVTVLLGVLAIVSPALGGGLLAAWGFLLMCVAGIWALVVAAREGVDQLLLNLFVPFYSLYYLVTRWDQMKHSFVLYLIGLGQYLVGALVFLGPLLMMAQQAQQK